MLVGPVILKSRVSCRTTLFEAVERDENDVVELLLLQNDLDVNALDAEQLKRTALMLAANLEHFVIPNLLLGHPYINVIHQDTYGDTALSLKTSMGKELNVRVVLEKAKSYGSG